MSKKLQVIFLAVVVCTVGAIVAVIAGFQATNAREITSVTADLKPGMVVGEAEALLAGRQFSKTASKTSDGDEFSFSKRVSPNTTATYFLGSVGTDRKAVMVRIDHRDGVGSGVLAERVRFKKKG